SSNLLAPTTSNSHLIAQLKHVVSPVHAACRGCPEKSFLGVKFRKLLWMDLKLFPKDVAQAPITQAIFRRAGRRVVCG
ncbi:MAG: hypothetical protein WBB85_05530, partial [Albidovulum sp.]|uniref:hypothetical protein n=1 Tax=Albidovulum sp. TaxID=1872424 RepID=UPI003CB0FAA8